MNREAALAICDGAAAAYHFSRIEGDTILWLPQFLRRLSANAPKLPIDLTGCTVRMRVAAATVVSLDAALVTPLEGRVSFDIGALALAPNDYKFEIEITFADGRIWTHTRGTLTIIAQL